MLEYLRLCLKKERVKKNSSLFFTAKYILDKKGTFFSCPLSISGFCVSNQIVVGPDGEVSLCPAFWGERNSFGDLFKSSLDNILN
ncbi:MAG: SPASM domain-containing protein, partial [Leptospiraceae bacterium]|nr:SPASM domain-containing protein [Leptospiraceae bacterium]